MIVLYNFLICFSIRIKMFLFERVNRLILFVLFRRNNPITLIKGVVAMKSRLKKKYLAQLVTIALGSMFAITAHTAPTVITNGIDTSATIADAGYFSATGSFGLSFMDREFVNLGTFSSNWSLNANGLSAGIANEDDGSNPFASTAITDIDGSILVTSSLGATGQ